MGEKACQQAVITKEMMALLEERTKEGPEKEHLEKRQPKVALRGGVWQGTSWGRMFQAEGDTMEAQHDHG